MSWSSNRASTWAKTRKLRRSFQFIEDDDECETLPTIGYMAYFEYLNGFRKVVYWSKEKMMTHADTSPAFSRQGYEDLMAGRVPEKDDVALPSFWYKNLTTWRKKTLLRHIISRWGIMSIEMTTALSRTMPSTWPMTQGRS